MLVPRVISHDKCYRGKDALKVLLGLCCLKQGLAFFEAASGPSFLTESGLFQSAAGFAETM